MATTALEISQEDRTALLRAVECLERTGLAARLADLAGEPVNRAFRLLPRAATDRLNRVVEASILKCLDWAIGSLGEAPASPATWRASAIAGVFGGLSGVFGVAALPIELPLTTTLMLRSIADIARHQGEDLAEIPGRLACMEVFALGGARSENRMSLGYYAARGFLARLTGEASTYLMERGVANAAAPAVTGFVGEIASRYGLLVSDKVAAEAVPIIGALGGAAVNVVFMDHFQRIAKGHFTIRRLERRYGATTIRRQYEAFARRLGDAAK
jgi:hypothetical protein